MAKKKYSKLEQKIITIFNTEGSFIFNNTHYDVINVDKPTTSTGECKTDVYVCGKSSNNQIVELKISVKTESSNEFQENKATASKMEAYFGSDWSNIIIKASKSISEKFKNLPLIYVSGKYPTKPNSITLGWKLEIASKPRKLCSPLPLTDKEVRDYVYKGTNLSEDKKNAFINGNVVPNSGVADYLLVTELDKVNSTTDIINQINLIDNIELSDCYIIFTANNYRTKEDKADGKRSLAVYINWKCINNKLVPEIKYNSPLIYTGEEHIKPILLKALNELGKSHPCDMNIETDVLTPKIVLP
ncbi:hypothetical protein [Clostridium sp. ZBS14]|uniref:hypothetical protein n=1 Tax=Clostridium sp. ZBS14 TaxID=2949970 RepID=UPI00207AE238|nr:hypothetical protein [Clostridium sp. ZBS14]